MEAGAETDPQKEVENAVDEAGKQVKESAADAVDAFVRLQQVVQLPLHLLLLHRPLVQPCAVDCNRRLRRDAGQHVQVGQLGW